MLENSPDVLTVKEVMKVLRCGRTKVMQFIHEGRLEGHYVCGKWLIFKSDVEEFILRS
jgi:excisionase family DNA binding protein